MIGNIYEELLRESIDYGYFKDKSNIPDYDAILFGLNNRLPKKYDKWVGEIKFMSGEEYFRECAKIAGTDVYSQKEPLLIGNINKIEYNMSRGIKYDIPYLNYVEKTQEGRHRVIAASNLGQAKIPVLVLYLKEEDELGEKNHDKIEDMVNIWDDLIKIKDSYYIKFSNINEYKTSGRLLSCIARNYDSYQLDYLLNNKISPKYYSLERHIKELYDSFNKFGYHNISNINYIGDNDVSDIILHLCVIYKIIINNDGVIIDCVKLDGKDGYLRVLDNISGDFDRYTSCEDMLLSKGQDYYIREYNLLSEDDINSSVYEVSDNEVDVINGILKK